MTESPIDPTPPTEAEVATPPEEAGPRRVIKRYSNRKLYDTKQSSYVTLLQIAELVRAGEDVQIIDNASKEDKTDITLALIISEELKLKPRAIPVSTLRALIRMRGGQIITTLREGPIGRLMPTSKAGAGGAPDESQSTSDHHALTEESSMTKDTLLKTLEQWQHTVDERVRAILPQFASVKELQGELRALADRLDKLESRLENKSE